MKQMKSKWIMETVPNTRFLQTERTFSACPHNHVIFSGSKSGGKDLGHSSKVQHYVVHASVLSTLHICGGESGYIEVFSWPLHASRTLYFHECAYYSGNMNSKLLAGRLGRCLGKSAVWKWSTKAVLQQYVLSATLGFLTVEKKTALCVASIIRLQAAYRRPSMHIVPCHSYDGCCFTSQSNSIEVFPVLTCSMYKFSQLFPKCTWTVKHVTLCHQ